MNYWNQVKTTVSIDGNPFHFTTLRLEQEFNDHHFFDIGIMCVPSPGKGIWHHEREGVIAMQGKPVVIRMKHEVSGEETIFRGFITEIKMDGNEGVAGMLHYLGYSPTILLESGRTMDSFTDYTLEEIVREVVRNYGNGVEVVIAPQFYDRIPYLQMQGESGYEFLRRIAYQYGEWFYYDGQKLYFGNPYRDKEEMITYDVELKSVSYKSHIIPFNFSRHEYLPDQDQDAWSDDSIAVSGINTYLWEAVNASNSFYKSHTTQYNEAVNNHPFHLNSFMAMEKGRDIAGMSCLQGKSDTCRVRLSHPVSVKIPATMCERRDLGRYRITSITHQIDSNGVYSNTFVGIPGNMKHIPVNNVKLPKAYPMLATVVSNADPQGWGRVQVQFAWQQEKDKSTNWIRVSSPDAGKSEAVPKNRGFVFIPEVGDQVIVHFEGCNPGRPYVQASLFRNKNAAGGQANNYIKSLMTSSGHMLEFNDDQKGKWGITFKDDAGNMVYWDTKNKNLQITSPETLSFVAKNIELVATEDIKLVADRNLETSSKQQTTFMSEKLLSLHAEDEVLLDSSGKISAVAAKDFMAQGEVSTVLGKDTATLSGNTTVIEGKDTVIQGASHQCNVK